MVPRLTPMPQRVSAPDATNILKSVSLAHHQTTSSRLV
jgi:hypothetical protein